VRAAPIEAVDLVPTRFAVASLTHNFRGDTTPVAVKIRLKRMGKIRVPQYRIVVVDSRKKRDGKVIEEIGKYHPKEEPSLIEVTSDRAQYWLGVGAQPSEAVARILELTGDWQKFKGLPGAEGTLKVAEARRDKAEIFNEALKEAGSEPKGEPVTRKAEKKKAEEAPVAPEAAPAEKAEKPAAEAPAEEAAAEAPAEEVAPAPAVAEKVPASETPEGAAEEAEVAETKAVDAALAEDKA
jgi:small subunit ribosomal protein S16